MLIWSSLAQIPFDPPLVFDDAAEPGGFLLGEVSGHLVGIHFRHVQDLPGPGLSDPVDVGQGNQNPLPVRYVHSN